MIDLHYYKTPNGHKVAIALEEMQLQYQLKPVDIFKDQQFAPAFLAISPNNKIPAIVDPQGPGGQPISVFESGAILQYLGRKTGQFYPAGERERVAVEQWLMWQMGGFGPMLGQNHHFGHYAPEKVPYAINRYQNETRRLYKVLDTRLAEVPYVAGDYSIADMAIFPWVLSHDWQKISLDDYPHVKAYMALLGERPAIQRALAIQA